MKSVLSLLLLIFLASAQFTSDTSKSSQTSVAPPQPTPNTEVTKEKKDAEKQVEKAQSAKVVAAKAKAEAKVAVAKVAEEKAKIEEVKAVKAVKANEKANQQETETKQEPQSSKINYKKKQYYSRHKIHEYHAKINAKIQKTLDTINKAMKTAKDRAELAGVKLANYGTRKVQGVMEIYNMADEDIKMEMDPIINKMKESVKSKEKETSKALNELVVSFHKVFTRTITKLEQARIVGDANNNAAKIGLKAVAENIAKGLEAVQNKKQVDTKKLRLLKKTTKDAEYNITHEFHKGERQEKEILHVARAMLKRMRHKGKRIFSDLKSKIKADYRKLFRETRKAVLRPLLNMNSGVKDYEY
ncbi:Uncharacterized protein QTN25_000510 [Entamoeba marina]